MKYRKLVILVIFVSVLGLISVAAAVLDEVEPNDSPAQANGLTRFDSINGAIDPVADVDYYVIPGVNVTWGFVALLQTNASTSSQQARLAALGNDGLTVLQEDVGSWEHGSGIALQNYADGNVSHYLRVNEDGDDAGISAYTLRYFQTIIATQPEVEPNETRLSGTPSGFTHAGVLNAAGDVDCFAFQGRAEDTILLALNGDPEGDGGGADYALSLLDPGDTVLKAVNVGGVAGNEFIEYENLPAEGVYAYCVSLAGGSAGSGASYYAGIVRNGGLYFPDYKAQPTWLNPPPGNAARIGDTLSFRVAMTNTSPLPIPGDVNLRAGFDEACLDYVASEPAPTYTSTNSVEWYGLRPSGLAPGEVFSATVQFQALDLCAGTIHQGTVISYYFTGTGNDANYLIATPLYLPLIRQE